MICRLVKLVLGNKPGNLLQIRQCNHQIAVVFQNAQKFAHRDRQFMRHKMLEIVAGKYGVYGSGCNILHVGHRADNVRLNGSLDIQPYFLPFFRIKAMLSKNMLRPASDMQ